MSLDSVWRKWRHAAAFGDRCARNTVGRDLLQVSGDMEQMLGMKYVFVGFFY